MSDNVTERAEYHATSCLDGRQRIPCRDGLLIADLLAEVKRLRTDLALMCEASAPMQSVRCTKDIHPTVLIDYVGSPEARCCPWCERDEALAKLTQTLIPAASLKVEAENVNEGDKSSSVQVEPELDQAERPCHRNHRVHNGERLGMYDGNHAEPCPLDGPQ